MELTMCNLAWQKICSCLWDFVVFVFMCVCAHRDTVVILHNLLSTACYSFFLAPLMLLFFFNFLLILCECDINSDCHPNPTNLSSCLPSAHLPCCLPISCAFVYTLLSTHLFLLMFTAMSHRSVSRPLASTTLSILDPHGLLSEILSLPCVMEILQP